MADGHWTIYSTHHDNIRVGLVNLLSSDVFSELKVDKNVLVVEVLPRTRLGSLQPPDSLAGL